MPSTEALNKVSRNTHTHIYWYTVSEKYALTFEDIKEIKNTYYRVKLYTKILLAFSDKVLGGVVTECTFSRVIQQLHMSPPLHKSNGLPPSMMQDMLKLQSNTFPLYQHVCGITEKSINVAD